LRLLPALLAAALPSPLQAELTACAVSPVAELAARAPVMGAMGLDRAGFERLTGTSVGMLHTYVLKQSGWGPIAGGDPEGQLDRVRRALAADPKLSVLISYPPIPIGVEGPPRQALGSCAAGVFNRHYLAFGRALAVRRLERIVLRVGWEWDAYYVWGAWKELDRARLYAACFRQVVRSIRLGYPGGGLLFEWNSTAGVTPELMAAGYPGGRYVDVVGVEGYDGRGGRVPARRWEATKAVLDRVRDFAQARGKRLAFSEWGVMTNRVRPSWGGGDNPLHVQRVCEYAKNPANDVLYLSYFNRSNDIADHRLETHPRALQAYRTHCRRAVAKGRPLAAAAGASVLWREIMASRRPCAVAAAAAARE
jgi:hypothetical protein